MNTNEFLIKFKEKFDFYDSSLEDMLDYPIYFGYDSIEKYKKREKRIDKYLTKIIKLKYKNFDDNDFRFHIRSNRGRSLHFDYGYFFLWIYEDNGNVINVRMQGYVPMSVIKYINDLLPDDLNPKDKYGFSDF